MALPLRLQQDSETSARTTVDRIVVFHPGSLNLRFGFANDPLAPKVIPNCIARLLYNVTHAEKIKMPPDGPSQPDDGTDLKQLREAEAQQIRKELEQSRQQAADLAAAEQAAQVAGVGMPRRRRGRAPRDPAKHAQAESNPSSSAGGGAGASSSGAGTSGGAPGGGGGGNSWAAGTNGFDNEASNAGEGEGHSEEVDWKWTDVTSRPRVLVGYQALQIPEGEPYELRWPIRHGYFNLENGLSSMQRTIDDIHSIWEYVLMHHLGLRMSQFQECSAVIIVPDLYERREVKELLNICLKLLGFKAAFVHQESVCACFGYGISSACVVDIGDQKTSVCIVEEGVALSNTRVHAKFGGRDVTRGLLALWPSFPLPDVDLSRPYHVHILNQLKHSLCYFSNEDNPTRPYEFTVQSPPDPPETFRGTVSSLPNLAPMGLFHPRLLEPLASGARGPMIDYVDHEEVLEDIINEAPVQAKPVKSEGGAASAPPGPVEMLSGSPRATPAAPRDSVPAAPSSSGAATLSAGPTGTTASGSAGKEGKDKEKDKDSDVFKAAPLDSIIHWSISRLGRTDLSRKHYSAILLAGGSSTFPGINDILEERLVNTLPEHEDVDTVAVLVRKREDPSPLVALAAEQNLARKPSPSPRDRDSFNGSVTWRGGAVMSGLESARDLWVYRAVWCGLSAGELEAFMTNPTRTQHHHLPIPLGTKVLRERALFHW